MKTYKNIFGKKLFYFILLFLVTIVSFIPIFIELMLMPKEINVIVGNEHTFNFNIPVVATIISDDTSVLNINNEAVSENTNFSLKNSFSIQSSEEGEHDIKLSLMGIPVASVKLNVLPNISLVPLGNSIGVRINTNGVMVLGIGSVKASDGKTYEPARNILKSGDIILKANSQEIQNKETIIQIIEESETSELTLEIQRNGEIQEVVINSVQAENGKNKIGIWVRDSTQGIGTITYYNPETNSFGALGHGIVDVDTKDIIAVKDGSIMTSEIIDIKKGEKGNPGELIGNIERNNIIGDVYLNSEVGIYGKITDTTNFENLEAIPVGLKEDVEIGSATILCNIDGNEVKEYEINIESINRYNSETSKSMVIRITDEELLKATNGIVQGMSGSPIIQNGKIIGAVTHVFLQEPDKGYGIFIENMIKQELGIN